jgi:hypothetical protein
VISDLLKGRWKRLEKETPEEYAARLRAFGDRHFEIIKGVRKNWNLSLAEAWAIVVTDREIELMLNYHFQRGVSRAGIRRVLQRELGMLLENVWVRADASTLWPSNGITES